MKTLRFFLLFISVLFLASCVDEDERMGLDLVGDHGSINVLRDPASGVSIEAAVFGDDSVKTKTFLAAPLGSYRDDNFGRLTSSIYTQLTLSTIPVDFTNLGQADSMVLTLSYSGVFAKSKDINKMDMRVIVNVVTEEIDTSKAYAYSRVDYDEDPIFDQVISVNPTDSVQIEDSLLAPHMRLRLNDNFVNKIMNSQFESGEDFLNTIKGLRISATNTDVNGMVAFINLSSSISGISLYYHTQSGRKSVYKFHFPTSGNVFVKVDKDYSNTPLQGLASSVVMGRKPMISANEYMYLAALGVAEIKLDILGLEGWYNRDSIKDAAINRAELILPVADNQDRFTFPSSLLCYRKTDSTSVFIRDEVIASAIGGGCKYDTTLNAYRILITSHLQSYLSGKYKDATIYIIPDPKVSSASRVILNGPNFSDPEKRPRLMITYSHPTNK